LASRNSASGSVHHLFIAWLLVILTDSQSVTQLNWLVLILGSLATFRVSHLMAKERGPLAIFERIRTAMPGGRGSMKEWVSCIWCFSLTASALVCLVLLVGGMTLTWEYWILHWLSFSSISLLVNRACG
jgi:hypothetical protein